MNSRYHKQSGIWVGVCMPERLVNYQRKIIIDYFFSWISLYNIILRDSIIIINNFGRYFLSYLKFTYF